MSIYIQISILVSLLIGLGTYILFKRRKKKAPIISEEDLKPSFTDSDIQKEEKVRKQWLNLFIIRITILLFANFLDASRYEYGNEAVLNLLPSLLIGSLIILPNAGITYYCAYKKRGIDWLILAMIILPSKKLASVTIFRQDQIIQIDALLRWSIVAVLFGIDVFYWVNCLRLYKVNLSRKIRFLMQPTISEAPLKTYFNDRDIQNEEKVRKKWFISFLIYAGLIVIVSLICACIDLSNGLDKNSPHTFVFLLSKLIDSLVFIQPWFWITYHCSYKKRGTGWLLWTIIILPLYELGYVAGGWWNKVFECDPLIGWSVVTVSVGFDIFYLVNCLRLYRVNLSRKKKKALAIRENYVPGAKVPVSS
jgi:hypothetical protein